jgi:hypothetical protein
LKQRCPRRCIQLYSILDSGSAFETTLSSKMHSVVFDIRFRFSV